MQEQSKKKKVLLRTPQITRYIHTTATAFYTAQKITNHTPNLAIMQNTAKH